MIDIKLIRKNPELIKKNLQNRGYNLELLNQLLLADKIRSRLLQEIESLRSEQKKEKNHQLAKKIKNKIKSLEPDLKRAEKNYKKYSLKIPNIIFDNVPIGGEDKNKEIKKWGKNKAGKNYLEIIKKYDLADSKRAAKISGSRFAFIKGRLAILEMALIRFAFDHLTKKGFIPILPPILIKKEALQGAGFPWEEVYKIKGEDLYLIGTSEHAMAAMHGDENLDELPKRYVGFSPCFRKEAGSYGKDTKGLFRMHQFDKVEMFSFCHPDKSEQEHKFMIDIEEELMQKLKIPYRLMRLASQDIGIASASTYDLEAWFPSQKKYRETHSCSNCTDFQARRLNIKHNKKFVHTLNGTVFSQRPLLAILENHGTKIPKALQKYTGFKTIN